VVVFFVVVFVVAGFFVAAGAFLAGSSFTGSGFSSKVGATTVLTAAFTNLILVPGVVSTMTVSSRIETIFPSIPPSITTSAPTATDASSCLAALARFLLLKIIKARKATRMKMSSTESQSIVRILVLVDYKRQASRIILDGHVALKYLGVYSLLRWLAYLG